MTYFIIPWNELCLVPKRHCNCTADFTYNNHNMAHDYYFRITIFAKVIQITLIDYRGLQLHMCGAMGLFQRDGSVSTSPSHVASF
jgi:hypothetical protein